MAKYSASGERGFTLIELVVVIAILGILAATATPMVNAFLEKSKEQAYIADVATIQSAADAYYSAPGNERHGGRRQYPIIGAHSAGEFDPWSDDDSNTDLGTPMNPLRGTVGGEPLWRDGGDGIRQNEENLNAEAEALEGTASGWHLAKVTLNGADYGVDTRDYFINFIRLVNAGLLDKVPRSASTDNGGGSDQGSYSWYLDQRGRVNSLYSHFPTNSGAPKDGDNRGFIEGVFP